MMTREQLIKECMELTMQLEGLSPNQVDRLIFETMSIEKLVSEYNWLWDMVHLK